MNGTASTKKIAETTTHYKFVKIDDLAIVKHVRNDITKPASIKIPVTMKMNVLIFILWKTQMFFKTLSGNKLVT